MLKPESDSAIYLTFNGNCRKAFSYYQHCFGGELSIQTLADTPDGFLMDSRMQQLVICASLETDYINLVGTDLSDDGKLIAGNRVAILLYCSSLAERARLINKLVERNFCSYQNDNALISVTDKFSVGWVLGLKSQK